MAVNAQNQSDARRILVAYFSWGGNTRTVAESICQAVGSDIFEVKTVNPYPKEYRLTTDVARQELEANARPALAESAQGMGSYDTVFLGYPNWWGTIPMALFTFLETYDFTGKTIIPFCTHEGSALGRSVAEIKRLCPGATVLDGLAVRGGKVDRAQIDVQNWLRSLGVVK
ncbi:MAG: flavodoxin [Spirochaetaceae bacterium]|jgi:flavodoxin|nr:flavodoxin [Spirochaetaceae bacterium]